MGPEEDWGEYKTHLVDDFNPLGSPEEWGKLASGRREQTVIHKDGPKRKIEEDRNGTKSKKLTTTVEKVESREDSRVAADESVKQRQQRLPVPPIPIGLTSKSERKILPKQKSRKVEAQVFFLTKLISYIMFLNVFRLTFLQSNPKTDNP